MKFYEIEIERRTKRKIILASTIFDANDAEDELVICGNLRGYTETSLADEDDFCAFGQFNSTYDKVSLVKELTQSDVDKTPLKYWLYDDEYEQIDVHSLKKSLTFMEAIEYCRDTGNYCYYSNIRLSLDDNDNVIFTNTISNIKLETIDINALSNKPIWTKGD